MSNVKKSKDIKRPSKQQKRHNDDFISNHNPAATDFVVSSQSTSTSKLWLFLVAILAVSVGVINRYHVANMFENDRHFSYLSNLEREMTFRTEMGLYYSYFKTIVNAPTFSEGLKSIIHDNVTEFGHTINTLKRFNLYPELVLASMYKLYIHVANSYNIQTQQCWKTERGQDLEPILSCEGMGNQAYFYVNMVFLLWGLVTSGLFLYGVLLSDSILGGLITCSSFFFNHGEATRVQWTPPLRESFGYPFCLLLMLLLTYMLKFKSSGTKFVVTISFLTICFMTSWQFASFVLSTQVGCIFVVYVLGYAKTDTLKSMTRGLLIGLFTSYLLLFGNEMILTSLFLSSLVTLQLILSIEKLFNKILKFRLLIVLCQLLIFALGTLGIKLICSYVLNVKDDAHVFDILKSKFTNYSDFHTKLYTCATEFDFMLDETPWKLSYTLILPAAVLCLLLSIFLFFKTEYRGLFAKSSDLLIRQQYGEIFYNAGQLLVFTVMAVIIMRLKLFFTPHLCILASLLASKKIFNEIFDSTTTTTAVTTVISRSWQPICCVLLIAGMAVEGVKNIRQQMAIMGEYSNPNQERLFEWILKNTDKNAVFAGPMPTMANLKLSTGRPIANHPHYEDAELRQRTVKVYSIFSRKSHEEVYETLKGMGIDYFVFEYNWCRKSNRPGCSMPELFDLSDVENIDKEPLCHKIHLGQLGPFKLAYENAHYKVLKITK